MRSPKSLVLMSCKAHNACSPLELVVAGVNVICPLLLARPIRWCRVDNIDVCRRHALCVFLPAKSQVWVADNTESCQRLAYVYRVSTRVDAGGVRSYSLVAPRHDSLSGGILDVVGQQHNADLRVVVGHCPQLGRCPSKSPEQIGT